MTIEYKSIEKLKGSSNYANWENLFLKYATIEGWKTDSTSDDGTVDVTWTTTATKIKEIKTYFLSTIDSTITQFDVTKSVEDILSGFRVRFGSAYVNHEDYVSDVENKMWLNFNQHPSIGINWLNVKATYLESTGYHVSDKLKLAILLKGLTHEKDPKKLWLDFKIKIWGNRPAYDSDFNKVEHDLLQYWSQRAPPSVDVLVPEGVFVPWGQRAPIVNQVSGRRQRTPCAHCEKHRPAMAKGHGTGFCWYGDNPGTLRLPGKGPKPRGEAHEASGSNVNLELVSLRALITELTNKINSKYSNSALMGKLSYDTGATPTSFVKDKPANVVEQAGILFTAGSEGLPTLGSGTIKFGEIETPATYVPSIARNLISGIALMKQGLTSVIANDMLILSTDTPKVSKSSICATGKLNNESGLLDLDSDIDATVVDAFATLPVTDNAINNVTQSDAHNRFGHPSNQKLQRTLDMVDGMDVIIPADVSQENTICEPCLLGKMVLPKIPKKSTRTFQRLEMISGDTQGPFRVVSHSGTNMNIKFVDTATKYAKMFEISDGTAATALSLFKPFLKRLERRTGDTCKYFMCDDGNEFKGEFHDFLEDIGIQKQRGLPYEHHIPPHAENLHKNIMSRARAMLIASHLPITYYVDSQLTATYLWNREYHAGLDKTPYELIYNRRPNVANLFPFGCVGFAYLRKEIRDKPFNNGKLENTSVKCRLLGYGDDDDSEEVAGYKILVEANPPYVTYSRNVKWLDKSPMVPLVNLDSDSYSDETLDDLFGNSNFRSDEEFVPDILHESSDSSDEPDLFTSESSNEDHSSHSSISSTQTPETSVLNDEQDSMAIVPNQEELSNLTNTVNLLYGPIFNSDRFKAAGVDSETLMYAFLALTDGIPVPLSEDDVMKSPEKDKWLEAMEVEMTKIRKYETFELVDLPNTPGVKTNVIKSRWVYRKKLDSKGKVVEYKARLVAKGYTQKYGIDFMETFAPVAKLKSIRTVLALAASNGLSCYQNDVPSAFLWPELTEELYMAQPEFYNDGTKKVWRLKRTLYGLKQSPREFYNLASSFLVSQGFVHSLADTCIFTRGSGSNLIIIVVYVDDFISAGAETSEFKQFRKIFEERFGMKESMPLDWYLGTKFTRLSDGSYTMDQSSYLQQKLDQFDAFIGTGSVASPLPSNYSKLLEQVELNPTTISGSRSVTTFPYREMVGSLMYAMVTTRFDLAFAVSLLSRYLSNPHSIHCDLVAHIYRYLKGNMDFKLMFNSKNSGILEGYVDAAYANQPDYKSTTGFIFTVGGTPVSWYSKRQSVVALSSAESEYIGATTAAKEGTWLKLLLLDLQHPQGTVTLYEDNEACIALSKNPQHHSRTKHIQVSFHYIRDQVSNKEFVLKYVPTKEQLADITTKGLAGHMIRPVLRSLNVIDSQVKGSIRNGLSSQ